MIRDWTCNCGKVTKLKEPTTEQSLKCRVCGRTYWVTGTHVDGRPMLRELSGDHRKTDQNRLISALQTKARAPSGEWLKDVDELEPTRNDHETCAQYGYPRGAIAKFFRHEDGCTITYCSLKGVKKGAKRA